MSAVGTSLRHFYSNERAGRGAANRPSPSTARVCPAKQGVGTGVILLSPQPRPRAVPEAHTGCSDSQLSLSVKYSEVISETKLIFEGL